MNTPEALHTTLRATRAELLAATHGLSEALLYQPGAVGEWSVAQIIAQRIEAENRALTLVQSMLHGHPVVYGLSSAELQTRDVRRRRDWDWANLLREFFQQREETNWNLESLSVEELTRPCRVGEEERTAYAVLMAEARAEATLAEQLWAWRNQLELSSHEVR